ncbi:uncharacterized protein LOC142165912 [Nicotiana tabacum]|uniref:Uncharacterized protein LOC142165912 n=1 Tax=Nicotiana tabacum TaxID=4097 RepID=A0AC58S5Z8_TOBAC
MYDNYQTAVNGRIWLVWDPQWCEVRMVRAEAQILHCEITSKIGDIRCYLTIVYGFNTVEHKRALWENLKDVAVGMNKPWLVAGDFNAVMYQDDRMFGNPITYTEVKEYSECMHELFRTEVHWRGDYYTWSNKQQNNDRIYSRLLAKERELIQSLGKWSLIEESALQQKAKVRWIKLGESNNKYFSALTKERTQRKQITELISLTNRKLVEPEEIREEIVNFYKGLMGSTTYMLPAVNKHTMRKWPCITQQQREEVTVAIKEFFKTGKMYRAINCTAITLVPKTAKPSTVNENRPIA